MEAENKVNPLKSTTLGKSPTIKHKLLISSHFRLKTGRFHLFEGEINFVPAVETTE